MSDITDNKKSVSHTLLILIALIYFISGVAALSYEILWMRMLSNLFGVSIIGIAVTVAAFLSGLGAGALVGPRVLLVIKNPLVGFALVELLVACFSFSLPSIVPALENTINTAGAGMDYKTWLQIEVVTVFAALFFPALLLGIGYVCVLNVVNRLMSVSILYGINTLGGVIGCLLPLVLLPIAGWTVSIRLVALLGILICILVGLLFLFLFPRRDQTHQTEPSKAFLDKNVIAYMFVGCASVMLQVAWARIYGMMFLRTEYVLSILLASFLFGIGIGSVLSRYIKPVVGLKLLPVSAAIAIYFSFFSLFAFAWWIEESQFSSLSDAMFGQGLVLTLLTLPTTIVLGIWYPLLVTHLKIETKHAGYLYAFNSIGAGIGALVAAFFITPVAGSGFVVVSAISIILAVSMVWNREYWYKLSALFLLVPSIFVINLPSVNMFRPVSQADTKDLFVYEDAISINHVIETGKGNRVLLSDLQRMDASSDWASVVSQKNQARLPLILHSEPRSVLFLGTGTGVTAAGSLGYPELERTAVEISEGAIRAMNDWFVPVNNDIANRLTVVRDDVRRFLTISPERYDVIIGDLFHPDLVGRSALLSVQQFSRVKNRLTDTGIFVQWIALNQFDVSTFNVVQRTFARVFPNGKLFIDGFRIALVGSKSESPLANNVFSNVTRLGSSLANEVTGGEGEITWLGRYVGPVVSTDGPIQDDWDPVLEFKLPEIRYSRSPPLVRTLASVLSQRVTAEEAISQLEVPPSARDDFRTAFAATERYMRAMFVSLTNSSAAEYFQHLRLAFELNPRDRWIGFSLADSMLESLKSSPLTDSQIRDRLTAILKMREDHPEVLAALIDAERRLGNFENTIHYIERYRALNPLDNSFQQ